MSEALRRNDDGTEARPYGRHSICQSCRYGKVQVRVEHNWRHPLEKPADVTVGEVQGPARVYRQWATCLHPDMAVSDHGLVIHPEYADVLRCEFREPREPEIPEGL